MAANTRAINNNGDSIDSSSSPLHSDDIRLGAGGDVESGAPAAGSVELTPESQHRPSQQRQAGSGREASEIEEHETAFLNAIFFWRAIFAESPPEWWLRIWSLCFQPSKAGRGDGGYRQVGGKLWSPAGFWSISVRVAMCIATGYTAYHVVSYYKELDYIFCKELPSLLSYLATLYMLLVLPGKFETIANRTDAPSLLDPKDVNEAARLPCIFMAFWVVYGIAATCIAVIASSNLIGHERGPVREAFFYLFQACASTPTLSASLFILSLDITQARKLVAQIAENAQKQTLTVDQYREASEAIHLINYSWKVPLSVLAIVASYNTVALIAYFVFTSEYYTTKYDTFSVVATDLFTMSEIGKEASLLFIFTFLARLVNDEADDVVTDVFLWRLRLELGSTSGKKPREDEGAAQGLREMESRDQHIIKRIQALEDEHSRLSRENRRLKLLMEGANLRILTPRNPANRRSMSQRLLSPKAGGIRFMVLGVRWSTQQVQALAASFVLAVVSVVVRRYTVVY